MLSQLQIDVLAKSVIERPRSLILRRDTSTASFLAPHFGIIVNGVTRGQRLLSRSVYLPDPCSPRQELPPGVLRVANWKRVKRGSAPEQSNTYARLPLVVQHFQLETSTIDNLATLAKRAFSKFRACWTVEFSHEFSAPTVIDSAPLRSEWCSIKLWMVGRHSSADMSLLDSLLDADAKRECESLRRDMDHIASDSVDKRATIEFFERFDLPLRGYFDLDPVEATKCASPFLDAVRAAADRMCADVD